MNEAFKKLIFEIKYTPSPAFENVKVLEAKLNDEKVFNIKFASDYLIPYEEMEKFLKCLNKNFKYKASPYFEVAVVSPKLNEVKKYVSWILANVCNKPHLASVIKKSEVTLKERQIFFIISSLGNNNSLGVEKDAIERVMRKFGFADFLFETELLITEDLLEQEHSKKMEEVSDFFEREIREERDAPEAKKGSSSRSFHKVELEDLVDSKLNMVAVKGLIFKKPEEFITKTGLKIVTYSITNYKDAVDIKHFIHEKAIKRTKVFSQGDFVSISGRYLIDAYSGNPSINVSKIHKIENPYKLPKDDATHKRVELNIRTKMSAMDGILTPEQIVDRAIELGHKAVAITDTNSIQSFPNFYNYCKDKKIKPIFGATLTAIDEKHKGVYNVKDAFLEKHKYVVFDLETTHLSPELGEIIEFGASIIENNKILKTIQFFIKPKKKISNFTTKLTGISNETVKEAKSEKEEILRIKEILESGIAVAHNAKFDLGFVNAKLSAYGHKEIQAPVIDSLVLSRFLRPDNKRFSLERIASHYNIVYDPTVAHRADYDANVLAKIWLVMRKELAAKNVLSLQDIDNLREESLYCKVFSKNVSVLAKNQKGIKELFKLISLGCTTQFFNGSKVFMKQIKDCKNLLLGSGGLDSRLVDLILYGTKSEIKEEIKLYDYIELLPISAFSHKIAKSFPESFIKEMLRFVYKEAKKQKKIVIASGDVRYKSDREKIYHEVLINAKGIGRVRHPLYSFNDKNPQYPTLSYLTTKEMIKEVNYLEDSKIIREVVVKGPNKIADTIEEVKIIKDKLYTPTFKNDVKELKSLVYKTAHEMYGDKLPSIVQDRIDKELAPIIEHGFSVIYWISHLLVAKSLKDGYLVGSRGSVGSSIIATFAKISEVNPLPPHYLCKNCKYSKFFPDSILNSGYDLDDKKCPKCKKELSKEGQNIPFETFLGFNADKVPDIDLNFSGDYQSTIHAEVKKLFGKKHAFRAGTISTVAEKTAFGYVLGWAEETNRDNSRAFNEFLAKGIEGAKRTTGQHPGGIIVIPQEYDVEDFTPVNYPANDINADWQTTHFDFHAIHDNVLKLDLLGHDDPTAIRMLEKLTKTKAVDIKFSDPKIVSLFSSPEALGIKPKDISGETTGALGIPEFGTRFVRTMLKTAKVKSFGDLIAVSGLSHGTNVWTNNAEVLIKSRGITLSEVISCRDNIMQYLIYKGVKNIDAFVIMEAVRKGKGLTEKQEKILIEKNVEDWYIDSLKKIEYMFPKAHATAYVMMAWRIAYYKLYHPLAYYATYLTTRSDNTEIEIFIKSKDEITERLKYLSANRFVRGAGALSNKEKALISTYEIIEEMISRGFSIRNISLEKSEVSDWIIAEDKKSLYPPFTAIDGLGLSAAKSVVKARNEGKFTSIKNLMNRTSLKKTSMQKLKNIGVLKELDETDQISFDLGI